MIKHIAKLPKHLKEQIYLIAWNKYQIKGTFESFSEEFFHELFAVCKV